MRQGCVLSPDLFALYGENILQEIEDLEGIIVGGVNINNVRYVDDTVLMADTEEKLQLMVEKVNDISEANGLRMNMKKTETMVVTKKKQAPECNITINGKIIKQVKKFVYLGSTITEDAKCKSEIMKRINIARSNFNNMKKILTNNKITIKTKKNIIRTYVWSSLLYGCETWTVTKEMQKKLQATEIWFYRRMLKVSWKDFVKNEQILERVGASYQLLNEIRQRQLNFLGHILRSNSTEKLILLGKINGKRDRGRQRFKFLDQFSADGSTEALIRTADDRKAWQSMIRQRFRRNQPP